MARLRRTFQSGASLLLFVTVLVLGISWYAVTALGRIAVSDAQRQARTAAALQTGKQALLAYVAQYAATASDDPVTWVPGRMPCPESLIAIWTAAEEGTAAGSCTNGAVEWGRLPWKTLGIDVLRDGDGEPLWYVLSPGFRNPAPTFPTPINFGTAGQLPYTDNGVLSTVVALIIAPGKALNTASDPGTPSAGCSKIDQTGRYAAAPGTALDPALFFECGNATGAYANPGSSPWTNDRVIAVTTAEWADTIAGPVAERLQRQVAPFLEQWRSSDSNTIWGTRFLPYAAAFGDPASNDFCGDTLAGVGFTEGLLPTARQSSTCTRWSTPTFTKISAGSTADISGTPTCSQQATAIRCAFAYSTSPSKPAPTVRVVATVPNIYAAFRARSTVADITFPFGNAATLANFQFSLNTATGVATLQVDMTPVATPTSFDIKYVPEWSLLSTDGRIRWFLLNNWDRYTYYAVSPGALANAATACTAGVTCITVNGLASGTGNANDKRLVLALMGRKLASQTQPNSSPAQYLESHTAPATVTGPPPAFTISTQSSTYNDRLAMCPFQYTLPDLTPKSICN